MIELLQNYFTQEKELYGNHSIDLSSEDLHKFLQSTPDPIEPKSEHITHPIIETPPSKIETHIEIPTINSSSLLELEQQLQNCSNCTLCENRTKVVFGSGNDQADLMIIGEAPGTDEDIKGIPFVGKAGQLLTQMLDAINIQRNDIYIANIVKCRPLNNRDPKPDEMDACITFLKKQIEFIKPKVILSLGRISGQTLTRNQNSLSSLRGRTHQYEQTELYITYHPAALLRNPKWKRATWEDLKQLKMRLDRL